MRFSTPKVTKQFTDEFGTSENLIAQHIEVDGVACINARLINKDSAGITFDITISRDEAVHLVEALVYVLAKGSYSA